MWVGDFLRQLLNRTESAAERGDSAFFAEIIEHRERLYRQWLGAPFKNAIATVSPDLLASALPSFDPSWSHAGVYVFPATAERNHWTYLTAGLSTPRQAAEDSALPANPSQAASGVGIELMFRTQVFDDWAISILNRLMVYELGVSAGLIRGEPLSFGTRVPLKPVGCESSSQIEAVVTCAPGDMSATFELRSGRVELIQLVGITAREYAWSIHHGVDALLAVLGQPRHWVTDFGRDSLPQTAGAELPLNMRKHFR
jgi:hypothetical protein